MECALYVPESEIVDFKGFTNKLARVNYRD